MQPLCLHCRFFNLDDEENPDDRNKPDHCLQGYCRVNPPTVGRYLGKENGLGYDYGQWPVVLSVDWCGAFQPHQAG